ncbi:hypothetical protein DFH09DRAFT_1362885 [Mycena vulgaris]|nr:hypothetical protein DFH09DRAFT_1362885 [Mycena vulgaris]
MIDTAPRGVQLTEVITPLPVKPSGLQLTLDDDTLKFLGEVRFWNMTKDAGSQGSPCRLRAAGVSSVAAGRYSAAWYAFNATEDIPFLSLNRTAGITNMRFTDGVVFSTSCVTSQDHFAGRFDVAVRNGLNPTRVYLEQELRDNVKKLKLHLPLSW